MLRSGAVTTSFVCRRLVVVSNLILFGLEIWQDILRRIMGKGLRCTNNARDVKVVDF